MLRDKKQTGIIIGISVLCFVIILGIAYAAFTQNLNVAGTANVRDSKWKVYFSRISDSAITTGTATVTLPTITNGTTPYTIPTYSIGDRIQIAGDESGDYYYVIANSPTEDDYVVALKENPLTLNDVNTNGTGYVNKYTYDSIGTAKDIYGYGRGLAYYSSSTCGFDNDNYVRSGCENENATSYASSDIKHVIDNWANSKFTTQLKQVTGYKARLIKYEELTNNLGCLAYDCISSSYDWIYNSGYGYWIMSKYNDSDYNVWNVCDNGGIIDQYVFTNIGVARPVVNIYKSSIQS